MVKVENVAKIPAKNTKILRTQKFRFELSPSKVPIFFKRLWDMEDELLKSFTTYGIAGSISPSLSDYFSLYSSTYSTDYLWLDYSQVLYYIYELRSVKCYLGVRHFDYLKEVYNVYIDSLYKDLVKYYSDVLKIHSRNIKKDKLKNTCSWFVYHLNRAVDNNSLGVRLSYAKNFYSDCKDDNNVSGRVVQKIVDMLEHNNTIYKFRGYKLLEDIHNNNDGSVSYSGETKAALTLLVFNGSSISKYTHNHKLPNDINKTFLPERNDSTYVEVRVKSKSKDIIPREDYDMSWLDIIEDSEKVLSKLDNKLRNSTIEICGYEIPELFFRRIWIRDIYNYGRIHDDGGFQTKSKEMRKSIIIDGLPTKTIDLSSIHPRYLYSIEGVDLAEDFDPYPVLNINLDTKRINKFKRFYNIQKYNPVRNLAKVSLLILLNASCRVEARQAILNKLKSENKKGMTYRESSMKYVGIPEDIDIDNVIDQLMSHNEPISKYFATNASSMLMSKDSDIIVSAINKLIQIDCVSLPLHDSLTVREDYVDEAILALKHGYNSVVGSLINFKCEVE